MAFSQRGSTLTAADAASLSYPEYGSRTALSADGNTLAVLAKFWSLSANNTAGIYTYDRSGSSWTPRGSVLTKSPGSADNESWGLGFLSLNSDGTILALGAHDNSVSPFDSRGAVYVHDRSGSSWVQRGGAITPATRISGDAFGNGGAISANGLVLIVASFSKVYRFTWNGSAWIEDATILAVGASAVAVNADGSAIAISRSVSDFGTGDFRVYTWSGSAWSQKGATITVSTGNFGKSIAMRSDADRVYVGSPTKLVSVSNQGALLHYDWSGSAWSAGTAIVAPDAANNDQFGYVATDGASALAVGAIYWEGSITDQGGVYILDYTPDPTGSGAATYSASVTGYGGIPNTGSGTPQYAAVVSGVGGFYVQFSTVAESAAAADASTPLASYYQAVHDGIRATTSAVLQAAYQQALSETALGQVVLAAGKHFEALIAEAVTGNVGAAIALSAQLVELSAANDVPRTQAQLVVDLAEVVVALASLANGTTYDFLETANANDVVAPRLTAVALLLESMLAADTATPALTLMSVVEEGAATQDTPAALLSAVALITEAANAGVLLRLGDDYYVGWVLNPEGMPTKNGPAPTVSQYQNYPFNSLARLNGGYYAAGAEGLYELTGSDDAGTPIVGYLKSGKFDFGSSMQKRLDSAYFAVATDGTVRLKVITHEDGANVETWYQVTSRDEGAVAENIRLKIGKGLRSRYWQFELVVEDAANFELEEFMLVPLNLTRRL